MKTIELVCITILFNNGVEKNYLVDGLDPSHTKFDVYEIDRIGQAFKSGRVFSQAEAIACIFVHNKTKIYPLTDSLLIG